MCRRRVCVSFLQFYIPVRKQWSIAVLDSAVGVKGRGRGLLMHNNYRMFVCGCVVVRLSPSTWCIMCTCRSLQITVAPL